MGARDFQQVLSSAPAISQQLVQLHASSVRQGTLPSVEFVGNMQALTPNTSQKTLVANVQKLTLRTLRAGMDDDAAAVLKSGSGKTVGAFLKALLHE